MPDGRLSFSVSLATACLFGSDHVWSGRPDVTEAASWLNGLLSRTAEHPGALAVHEWVTVGLYVWAMQRRWIVLATTLVLVGVACSGSDDADSVTAEPEETESEPALAVGEESATAEIEAVELVWVLDGEPVGGSFDYSEPIDRDRFDAGLRLELRIVTDGDLGGFQPDLRLPVTINGDQIDGGSTFGPERSRTRPEREDIEIVDTADGFIAQIDIGMPLSPLSLIDERERAERFGLNPDAETQVAGDLQIDVAALVDVPAAPDGDRNVIEYGFEGSIEFGNGFEIERLDRTVRLTVAETPTERFGDSQQCGLVADNYLDVLERELAEPEVVVLDRLRAFDTLQRAARDGDCTIADLDLPVCTAAKTAEAEGVASERLARHLDLCPPDDVIAELEIDESLVDPTFENGTVIQIVPRTLDGLSSYAIAYSVPASWELSEEAMTAVRQAVRFDPEVDDIFGSFVFGVRSDPGRTETRLEQVVSPEDPAAELLVDDTVTIAGRPAQRLIALGDPEFADLQIGTGFAIDESRIFSISAFIGSSTITAGQLVELIACIESSIVVEDYDPDALPEPAADCSALETFVPPTTTATVPPTTVPTTTVPTTTVPLTTDPLTTAAATTTTTTPPVITTPPGSDDPTFDGLTVRVPVPEQFERPAYVVTVAAPPWSVDDIANSSSSQRITLAGPEQLTMFVVRVGFVGDYEERENDAAEPLSDDWSVVSDDVSTFEGRRLRTVISSRPWSTGGEMRTGKLLIQINEQRILEVRVRLAAENSTDLDQALADALATLTVTP